MALRITLAASSATDAESAAKVLGGASEADCGDGGASRHAGGEPRVAKTRLEGRGRTVRGESEVPSDLARRIASVVDKPPIGKELTRARECQEAGVLNEKRHSRAIRGPMHFVTPVLVFSEMPKLTSGAADGLKPQALVWRIDGRVGKDTGDNASIRGCNGNVRASTSGGYKGDCG